MWEPSRQSIGNFSMSTWGSGMTGWRWNQYVKRFSGVSQHGSGSTYIDKDHMVILSRQDWFCQCRQYGFSLHKINSEYIELISAQQNSSCIYKIHFASRECIWFRHNASRCRCYVLLETFLCVQCSYEAQWYNGCVCHLLINQCIQ